MFEVECIIDSKHSFTTQFYVNLTPSAPAKWKILTSSDAKNGVQCDPGDLAAKVVGVWLVDEHGNDIPGDFLPSSSPSLCISWTPNANDEMVRLDHSQELILTLEDSDPLPSQPPQIETSSSSPPARIRKYVLSSEATLLCDRSLPAPFWIWAYDGSSSYQHSVVALNAIASYPSKILLRCSSIFGNDSLPSSQLEPIPFTNTSVVDDLEIFLLDENGHEASLASSSSERSIQDLTLQITSTLTPEILHPSDHHPSQLEENRIVIFYSKKNFKKNLKDIRLNFHKLIEVVEVFRSLSHEELFELNVSCSYKLNDKKIQMTSGLIICKYLLLNLVTKLIPTYRILPSSSHTSPPPPLPSSSSFGGVTLASGNDLANGNANGDDLVLSADSVGPHDNLSSLMAIENGIQCGKESKINLVLQTEDNQLVEIDPTDIDIKVAYEDSEGNESTEEMQGFDHLKDSFYVEYSNTNQTIVSYLVPKMTRTGKYTFHFTYSENRPKVTTNKFIPQAMLKVSQSLALIAFSFLSFPHFFVSLSGRSVRQSCP
jgi:hypothetical protein